MTMPQFLILLVVIFTSIAAYLNWYESSKIDPISITPTLTEYVKVISPDALKALGIIYLYQTDYNLIPLMIDQNGYILDHSGKKKSPRLNILSALYGNSGKNAQFIAPFKLTLKTIPTKYIEIHWLGPNKLSLNITPDGIDLLRKKYAPQK